MFCAKLLEQCKYFNNFSANAWHVLVFNFFEHFAFYGVKSSITIYLDSEFGYSNFSTTGLFHAFNAVAYLSPIIGAVISDNKWGRFKTIVCFCGIHVAGYALLTFAALIRNAELSIIALFLVSFGSGSIKACLAPFGGDQVRPHRIHDIILDHFFAMMYLSTNLGVFISELLTPILQKEVLCFGRDCYALSFGVLGIVFLSSYSLLLLRWNKFTKKHVYENVIMETIKCIHHTTKRYIMLRRTERRSSFLDYADESIFSSQFVAEVRKVLSVMILFVPFPLFWALFDQQGSRWTIQAGEMNNYLSETFFVKPSQIQMLNPFLIILAVPLFRTCIYPLLEKCNLCRQAVTRIFSGYICAALAFVVAGVIQIYINKGLPTYIPNSMIEARFLNPHDCALSMRIHSSIINIPQRASTNLMSLDRRDLHNISLEWPRNCIDRSHHTTSSISISVEGASRYTILLKYEVSGFDFVATPLRVNRSILGGNGNIRVISIEPTFQDRSVILANSNRRYEINLLPQEDVASSKYCPVSRGDYVVSLSAVEINSSSNGYVRVGATDIGIAETDTLFVTLDERTSNVTMIKVEEQWLSLVHVAWQCIQYVTLTCGEVLFSITSVTFIYTEAPASMKALLQSAYLITICVGNFLVIIAAAIPGGKSAQVVEFFVFASAAFMGAITFAGLVRRYNQRKVAKLEKYASAATLESSL